MIILRLITQGPTVYEYKHYLIYSSLKPRGREFIPFMETELQKGCHFLSKLFYFNPQ